MPGGSIDAEYTPRLFPPDPLRAQAEDVLTAERRDRSLEDGRARGPDADLLRDFRSQSRIRRHVHQRQRSSDALVGHEAEERRLLQLHGQSLSQCFVEYWVPRPIREVGQDDTVLVGKSRGGLEIEMRRGKQRQRPYGGKHACAMRFADGDARQFALQLGDRLPPAPRVLF